MPRANADLLISLLDRLVGVDNAFVTHVFSRHQVEESPRFSTAELRDFKMLAANELKLLDRVIREAHDKRDVEKSRIYSQEIWNAVILRNTLEQYATAIYKEVEAKRLKASQKRMLEKVVGQWQGKGVDVEALAQGMGSQHSKRLVVSLKVTQNRFGQAEIRPENIPRIQELCTKVDGLGKQLFAPSTNQVVKKTIKKKDRKKTVRRQI